MRAMPSVIVIGHLVTDIVVRLREPLVRASDTRSAIQFAPSGSGANQAAWLVGQGLDVHFVGRVGNDAFGAARLDELRATGVTPHCAVDAERPTGTIVVLVEP